MSLLSRFHLSLSLSSLKWKDLLRILRPLAPLKWIGRPPSVKWKSVILNQPLRLGRAFCLLSQSQREHDLKPSMSRIEGERSSASVSRWYDSLNGRGMLLVNVRCRSGRLSRSHQHLLFFGTRILYPASELIVPVVQSISVVTSHSEESLGASA